VLKDCFLTRYTTAEFLNYKNAHELHTYFIVIAHLLHRHPGVFILMMKMTNDQGHMIDDQFMTIAVPGQIRQKLGSEILGAVPAHVIVGLGVSGGDYPSTPRRGNTVRASTTTYRGWDQRGPGWSESCDRCGLRKHNHFNDCPAVNQNCRGCGAKVIFCADAVRSGEPKIIGIDGQGVFR